MTSLVLNNQALLFGIALQANSLMDFYIQTEQLLTLIGTFFIECGLKTHFPYWHFLLGIHRLNEFRSRMCCEFTT